MSKCKITDQQVKIYVQIWATSIMIKTWMITNIKPTSNRREHVTVSVIS